MGLLPEVLRIGPLALSPLLVAWMIALLVGLWLLGRELNKRGFDGEKQSGWLFEGMLAGFVVYRIVTVVGDGWTGGGVDLRSLLIAIGPTYAVWAGAAAAVLYVYGKARRAGVFSWRWLEAWTLPVAVAVVVHSLLLGVPGRATELLWGVGEGNQHPLNLYRALLWCGLAGLLLRMQSTPVRRVAFAVAGGAAVELVVSWFAVTGALHFGMSWAQWLLLFLFALALYIRTATES